MSKFLALPGFYKLLFLYFEPGEYSSIWNTYYSWTNSHDLPVSTISPALIIWLWPGASWFHHQLVPSSDPSPPAGLLDNRTVLAVWQLGNCYMLLGLISSLVFRAVRDALWDNPAAQEQIIGSTLTALAIADVTHVLASFIGLPPDLQFKPASWNATTHGNITFTIFLFSVRMAWFMGIGRQRYYFGKLKVN